MRPAPIKQGPEDLPFASSSKTVPVGPIASGAGFFTPGWRPAPNPPQPFRMGLPIVGRDSMYGDSPCSTDCTCLKYYDLAHPMTPSFRKT